jgi:hypothetical protein
MTIAGTDAQRQAAYDRALTQIAGRIRAFVPLASRQVA